MFSSRVIKVMFSSRVIKVMFSSRVIKVMFSIHLFLGFMYFPFENWVYGIERHFQQYFSYFVVVSFIGG
jgi:hypothetical protein